MPHQIRRRWYLALPAALGLWAAWRGLVGHDDWEYSPAPIAPGPGPVLLAVLGVVVLAWLATALTLSRGKPRPDGANPKRFVGLALLLVPPVAFGAVVAAMRFGPAAGLGIAVVTWAALVGACAWRRPGWAVGAGAALAALVLLAPAALLPLHLRALFATSANVLGGSMASRAARLGFAVGGAKDAAAFRANLENGYLPRPSDLTAEGLFYEYYFDTGEQARCEALFCPSFATAVSPDPFSEQPEHWLSVGLNSNLTVESFARKRLNLVVVLDISGSMGSSFDRYHYDPSRGARGRSEQASKMQVATRSVAAMLDHLGPEDRFGVVLFDDEAHLGRRLKPLGDADLEELRAHLLEIEPRGGTHFAAGFRAGVELFDALGALEPGEWESRIVFLTDAMPNLGETRAEGLFGLADAAARRGVHSTFVGVGVDFNTELVEQITRTRGANYLAVHSAEGLSRRLDEEFDYLVTPMVFDLRLDLESSDFEIEAVYGSPEAELGTGTLMRVNTLFPSPTQEGETKGGVVLLKLRRLGSGGQARLRVSYVDREGRPGHSEATVSFGEVSERYANTGVRKAVALAREVELLHAWMRAERQDGGATGLRPGAGIPRARADAPQAEGWERGSTPLRVSPGWAGRFEAYAAHLDREASAVGDPTLGTESQLMRGLAARAAPGAGSR